MQQFGEFFLNQWPLFLTLAIIIGLLIAQTLGGRLRGYKEVEPSDAVRMMNREDAVVLDVREDNEFREGHILGAVHIPLGFLATRAKELEKYRGKPLIVGCRSGARSSRACAILSKQGFDTLYNLRGGIIAWQNAGLPVEKGGKSKKRKD